MRSLAFVMPLVAGLAGCARGVSTHAEATAPSAPEAREPAALAAHRYDHETTSSEGSFTVAFSFDPAEIPLNEPFDVDVRVADPQGRPLDGDFEIDARMPDHRHGMLRAPRIASEGDGVYHVRGMLCHMPGRWELHFDLERDGVTERATWEVELE